MMKWKVVKNPRCVSADRSLECLRRMDLPTCGSDSNNNQCKPEINHENDNYKQKDSGFTRKPSLVASDCMNLKSFLGLTRQRSEINLSNLGLIGNEPRRSRSEVRGISCDRLTIGYHTPSIEVVKQPSANPPSKSGGWLRGRKKEREVKNTPKDNSTEIAGKTVVTGTRRTSSKPCDTRTIADQTCGILPKNLLKLPSEGRRTKFRKNNGENVIEEDIYVEIGHPKLKETKDKVPPKAGRKKGQAPKPQIASVLLKESNCDVNLNPNGVDSNITTNCFIEKRTSPLIKSARKLQAVNGRNEDRHSDNRTAPTVKLNNLKNSETFLTVKNKISSDSNTYVTVAEIHKNTSSEYKGEQANKSEDIIDDKVTENENKPVGTDPNTTNCSNTEMIEEKGEIEQTQSDIPLYHIDTPDYSTLESIVENSQNRSSSSELISNDNMKNAASITDLINCLNVNYSPTDTEKSFLDGTISSILRDSSNDPELAPKKVVRFERMDLIETYKKNKAESVKDSDEESVISNSEKKDPNLDVNSNEITPSEKENNVIESPSVSESDILDKLTSSSSDCFSESSATSSTESESPQKAMTVNVIVRNPSPECTVNGEPQTDEVQTQLVVKKSFVLTVAKQEKGFKSLCANKKPEVTPVEPPKADHKISVTFLCSEPPQITPSEPPVSTVRLRSISVPPQILKKSDIVPILPVIRGRSRERRPKDRQHHKKSHKSKKKDSSHHMPQAVIDELSQVLEKRKPSLDKKTAPRSS